MLKGKKIVNFGDSIFGNFRAPEDISSYIAEQTGANVYNVGFGGCRMAKHVLPQFGRFSMYKLADAIVNQDFKEQNEAFDLEPIGEPLPDYFKASLELLKSIDFDKVDIITIAYGTNDYTGHQPLDSSEKYDTDAYGGALRYSIEKIKNRYPHIKIAVCSQLYRCWRDEDGNLIDDSDSRIINGRKLCDFIDKTEEITKEYGLLFINNYTDTGINKESIDKCFSKTDGAHPIPFGRKLIALSISQRLDDKWGKI